MQYLLLIYDDETTWAEMPEAERNGYFQEYMKYTSDLQQAGVLVGADQLQPTSTATVAEDALQDAIAAALERWPRDGVPANPAGWLVTVARNRAVDRIRRDRTLQRKTELLARLEPQPMEDESTIPDERLSLIFTCCHPALGVESRIALTLRSLGGLETGEIARAFLVPEATMAQRLVRAK